MTDAPSSPHGEAAGPTGGRVVVGVDGSDTSLAALRWALGEARLRGAGVHAVMGWTYHPSWDYSSVGETYAAPSVVLPSAQDAYMSEPHVRERSPEVDASAEARKVLESALTRAVHEEAEGSGREPVPATSEALEGHAAEVLLGAVTDSDLLVVGSHGHGGFAGALLGSVSHHVLSHARCPVVVVPHAGRRSGAGTR